MQELIVKIEGNLSVIDNIEEVAPQLQEMIKSQDPSLMQTDEDFEGGKEFIKKLEVMQKAIKTAEESLYNDDMERVKKLLDDLNKTCASTKTRFKKAISERKQSLIRMIIVDSENELEKYFDSLERWKLLNYEPFRLENLLRESFKGKSSLKSMANIAKEITNNEKDRYKSLNDTLDSIIESYKQTHESMDEPFSKSQGMKDCVRYLNNGRDAEFVKNDLFRIITEVQNQRKAIEEKKKQQELERLRIEEEKRKKEEAERLALEEENQIQAEALKTEATQVINEQEIIENKDFTIKEEVVNSDLESSVILENNVDINTNNKTYFLAKYKRIGEHTQILLFAGCDEEHLARCGQFAMKNKEFEDFKEVSNYNKFINLNEVF